MTQFAIEVKNLTKEFVLPHQRKTTLKNTFLNRFRPITYEKIKSVDNVSLKVKKGEFLGIIGPNGAGKSTLLKLISGIYQPNSGSIKVMGSISPFIELRVGFQPGLTAKDNVFLYGALLGLTRKEINERYDKIVKFAGLKNFMDQQYDKFSSGMQMRLAFAITVHAGADILLVDEALAVGDQSFRQKCLKKMVDLNKKGKTIIFVSHSLGLIKKTCKRCLWFEKGNVKKIGSTINTINKYKRYYSN